MSVLDTLKAASRRTREVTLCVDGSLQAEYEEAHAAVEQAAEEDVLGKGSLANPSGDDEPPAEAETSSLAAPDRPDRAIPPRLRAALEAREAIRDRMAASLVTFRFEQIPWTERLALQADHPPREGNIGDQYRQYNVETFVPALIRAACVAVVGADGDEQNTIPDDVWDSLLAALNFQQVNLLSQAALMVNDQDTQVPTSARFLLESQDSEASSKSPDPGTSPRSGGADGSRRRSTKSSTTKKAASSE